MNVFYYFDSDFKSELVAIRFVLSGLLHVRVSANSGYEWYCIEGVNSFFVLSLLHSLNFFSFLTLVPLTEMISV